MEIEISIFLITTSNKFQAEELADKLITNKLAACVNILPDITSIYSWAGKIEKESEVIMLVKSRTELFDQIKDFVKQNHSYDVPEIIRISAGEVEENYYKWLISNTRYE